MSNTASVVEKFSANAFELSRGLSTEERHKMLDRIERAFRAGGPSLPRTDGILNAARQPGSFAIAVYLVLLATAKAQESSFVAVLTSLLSTTEAQDGVMAAAELHAVFNSAHCIVTKTKIVQAPSQSFQRRSDDQRCDFVRELTRLRISTADERTIQSAGGAPIKEITQTAVLTLPEASILRIVEQYVETKQQPIPDQLVLRFLNEQHSSQLKAAGTYLTNMEPPYSLMRYARHFTRSVHRDGVFLPTDDWIFDITRRALNFCRGSESAVLLETDYGPTH